MMWSNAGNVQQVLQNLTERRRRRITWNGLTIITTGLIVVYNDHSTIQMAGLILTLIGIGMLVIMLRGVFDLEQRMADSIAHTLEDAHYDDIALAQLWSEAVAKAAKRDDNNALVIMRAIEVVRERRRSPTDLRVP